MTSLVKPKFNDTMQAIDEFLAAPHKGKVLDQDLKVVEKGGFSWIWLCLMAPFYRFFGTDPYSHVRVHQVANKILLLCRENEKEFRGRPILVRMVKERILDRLNAQTKKKYEAHLKIVTAEVEKLAPAPQIPADYLNRYKTLSTPQQSPVRITQEVQNLFFAIFEKTFPSLKQDPQIFQLKFEKEGLKNARVRKLQLVKFEPGWQGQATITWFKVPVSFYVEYRNGLIHDVILLSKVKLGEGGQTSVRSCFGFLTGRFLARKKFSRDETVVGEPLFRHLFEMNRELSLQKKELRGIVAVEAMRAVPEDRTRLQVFESMYDGTLAGVFSGELWTQFPIKKRLFEDLLYGLHRLHISNHPGLRYNNGQGSTGRFPIAHCDLKPGNVLVKEGENTLQAYITDFGMINPLESPMSIGFRAPERIQAQRAQHISYAEAVDFYKSFGQPGDIWALGLILSMILHTERTVLYRIHYPPLKCIQDKIVAACLNKGTTPATIKGWFELEESLITLTQPEIDASVAKLMQGSVDQTPIPHKQEMTQLWTLVGQMLQVDPKKRLTATQAVQKLEALSSDSKVDK